MKWTAAQDCEAGRERGTHPVDPTTATGLDRLVLGWPDQPVTEPEETV